MSEKFKTGRRTRNTVVLMDQRISLITLGVADVSRARAFYEALGWQMGGGVDDDTDHVAFFQAGGMVVALWGRDRSPRTAPWRTPAAGAA